jgi:hypothetical protein
VWTATLAFETAVIGHNPEAADMTNPRGEIYGDIYFVLLTHKDGRRLIGPTTFGPTSRLHVAIQRSLDRGFDPTKSDAFRPFQAVYASEAHDEECLMTQGEMEMRHFGRTNELD